MPDRRLVERAAVLALLLAFGAWHWARLEQPHLDADQVVVLGLLGVLPAAVARATGSTRAGLAALVGAVVAAVGRIWAYWPWDASHALYPWRIASAIEDGAREWFAVHTPFPADRFTAVHHDVEITFFALAAVLGWLVLMTRFVVPSLGLAFVLFAVPSTVVPIGGDGFRAALFLCLCLLLLHATGRRAAVGQAWLMASLVVVGGLVIGAAPGINKAAFLSWQGWNPLQKTPKPVDVSYVWNQTYGPLQWPKKKTVVLNVWSPRPLYWKAATLDSFASDHWVARPQAVSGQPAVIDDQLTIPGEMVPSAASVGRSDNDIVTVRVKVLGLADDHLIAAAQPLQWSVPSGFSPTLNTDDTVTLDKDPGRGTTYDVRVYDPNPSATQLAKRPAAFPPDVQSGIVVNGTVVPPWHSGRRLESPIRLSDAYKRASRGVWLKSGADRAKTLYAAVNALEIYFRSKPFRYDTAPHFQKGVPPLVDFMTRSHRGYCQMFSGAMALVLRMHGIPARIGVGFTTGEPPITRGSPYVVTDRNAHAWVEVYFSGYGWIPFDPTPTRHLPMLASTSNPTFAQSLFQGGGTRALTLQERLIAEGALRPEALQLLAKQAGSRLGAAQIENRKTIIRNRIQNEARRSPGGATGGPAALASTRRGSFLKWAAAFLVAALAALAAVKFAAVRWRYLRRGPRAKAAAAYHELATFMGDQGVELHPSSTFEDIAAELRRAFEVDARKFAESASLVRYAPPERVNGHERLMRRELRAVKREVRRELSSRDRAVGALKLRSALSQTDSIE